MIKVKNEKIELSIYKNGNFEKKYTFKNSLTNLFIKSVIYNQLKSSVASQLFPTLSPITGLCFGNVYFDFTIPKQSITNDTETVTIVYNDLMSNPDNIINYTERGKQIITTYYPSKTFTTTDKLQYLFFGQPLSFGSTTMKLSSYVDLSSLNIYPDSDTTFQIIRYDEIDSNEKGILELNSSNDYLPFIQSSTVLSCSPKLIALDLCYEANGQNMSSEYTYSDLNWSLIDSETIELTGFDNFYKGIFDYPQNDYPQEDYPQNCIQIKSVKFIYEYSEFLPTKLINSYVNIKDLDITYNNTEFKIRLKCERGVY